MRWMWVRPKYSGSMKMVMNDECLYCHGQVTLCNFLPMNLEGDYVNDKHNQTFRMVKTRSKFTTWQKTGKDKVLWRTHPYFEKSRLLKVESPCFVVLSITSFWNNIPIGHGCRLGATAVSLSAPINVSRHRKRGDPLGPELSLGDFQIPMFD